MATDFGSNNNSTQNRYFEFPTRPEWGVATPSSTPHTFAAMLQIPNSTGNFYGYYHSTGNWGDSNSLNVYHGEDGSADANDLQVRYSTVSALNRPISAPDGTLGDGQWRLYAYRVPSGQVASYVNIDGTNVRVQGGSNPGSPAYNPSQILFGTRADFQNDRWYKNRLAWYGQWVGYSFNDQDMLDLANGTITPFELQNTFLQVLVDFTDPDNVRELISGDTPTRFGTGWAFAPQPYPTAPAQDTVDGDLAATNADDIVSMAGIINLPDADVTGDLAATNADDTAFMLGQIAQPPPVIGDLAATNTDDTAAMTGIINVPDAIEGDLAAVNADDVVAMTGTVEGLFSAVTGGDTTVSEATVNAGTWSTTITLTSIGDEWVPEPAFGAIRQDIIDGFQAASSPPGGWNLEVRAKENVTSVVRTSDTVVTINWSPSPLYDISNNEQVDVTVPDAATVGAGTGPSLPSLLITTITQDVFTVREVVVSNLGDPGPTPAVPTTGTHDVPLPQPIVTGDLLVMIVAFRGNQNPPTPPVGWTEIETVLSFSSVRSSVFARYADGTEGATAQVLSDGFRWGQAHVYRFDKDYVAGNSELADVFATSLSHEDTGGGTGRIRNPPRNDSPWGAESGNMWICAFIFNNRYVGQYYPVDELNDQLPFVYGKEIDNGTGAGSEVFSVTIMSCYLFEDGASVEPDRIGVPDTTSDIPRGTTYTIAVRGTGAFPIPVPSYVSHGVV